MAAGLRALAGPVREDAVEHVERLAHLLRVRVRAEVDDPAPVPLAREHHARVVVLDRDRDVRERLVVAQADVERRAVALDQVLLQVQRLDLGVRDDHLDVGDPLRQPLDRRARVRRGLEVRAHARPQRLRLADVEHLAALVAEEVDAGLRRKPFQLLFQVCGHGRARVASDPVRKAVLAAVVAAAAVGGVILAVVLSGGERRRLVFRDRRRRPLRRGRRPGRRRRSRRRSRSTTAPRHDRRPARPRPPPRLRLRRAGRGRRRSCSGPWTTRSSSRARASRRRRWTSPATPASTPPRSRPPGSAGSAGRRAALVHVLGNVAAATRQADMQLVVVVWHGLGRDTPQTPAERADFAAYAAALVKLLPQVRAVIVGNEPNLSTFWKPQFGAGGQRPRRPRVRRPARAQLRRDQDRAPVGAGARRRALAARRRPARRLAPDPLADRVHPRPRRRLPRERPRPAADGRASRSTRTWRPRRTRRTPAHPENTTITLADYPKLVSLLGQAFRGTAQPGARLPVYYTEFGVQTAVPAAKRRFYDRPRLARAHRQRLLRHAGRLLPPRARARLLPADRPRPVRLPHLRRAGPRRLAVGPLLRRPHAEAEPARLQARRRRPAQRQAVALPR